MGNENIWRERVATNLMEVPVGMTVRLGTANISGREVLQLQVGDVIQLNERCEQDLNVYVEDVLKMRGAPGSCKGNKAIQVTELVKRA